MEAVVPQVSPKHCHLFIKLFHLLEALNKTQNLYIAVLPVRTLTFIFTVVGPSTLNKPQNLCKTVLSVRLLTFIFTVLRWFGTHTYKKEHFT